MAEITYLCKRTVVSAMPVHPGIHHDLSVLDRLMDKKHFRIVFYYPQIAGDTTRRLRESLSEMLDNFPMVTGRLVKNDAGKWRIKCNDAGVRMVEATAKGSVEDWLKKVNGEMELDLAYWEDVSHKPFFWSTFNVQITEFEGGGFAVGLSCHHILADPISATMFVKAWADATSAQRLHGPPLFQLPPRPINEASYHIPLNNPLIKYYESSIEKPPQASANSKHKTIALAFTDPNVRACIALAQQDGPLETSPSPFAALAGLFWARISRIRGGRLVNMSICLDRRRALHLESDTFGNCMVCNRVEAEDQGVNIVGKAVRATERAAAEMDGEDRIRELIEWLERNEGRWGTLNNGEDLMSVKLEEAGEGGLTAFERGIGALRISYYVEPVGGGGQVLVMRSTETEGEMGRVVMVTVGEDEAVKLLEDELILSLKPKVLF